MCSIHSRICRHVKRVFCLCNAHISSLQPHPLLSFIQWDLCLVFVCALSIASAPTHFLSFTQSPLLFHCALPLQHDVIVPCTQVTTYFSFAHWIETFSHDHVWRPRPFTCLLSIIPPLQMLLSNINTVPHVHSCWRRNQSGYILAKQEMMMNIDVYVHKTYFNVYKKNLLL